MMMREGYMYISRYIDIGYRENCRHMSQGDADDNDKTSSVWCFFALSGDFWVLVER